MDVLQVVSVLGSVVVIVGLLRMHRFVVREYVLPEIHDPEEIEK